MKWTVITVAALAGVGVAGGGIVSAQGMAPRDEAPPAAATAPAATPAPTATATLTSARIDATAGTVTLPLRRGRTADGKVTWYVVTDSSDRADATRRGVNWAPRAVRGLGTRAVQRVTDTGGELRFAGTVDFSPVARVVPGPQGFPPKVARAGAVGDARYSPLVTRGDGIVLNAPQVANDTGRSDSVVAISPDHRTVTLRLLGGFFAGQRVLYTRTDASAELVAALESSTWAPNLAALPGQGSNRARSGRSAIVPVVNGPRGRLNGQRQGLESAVLGEGPPLNVTQSFPNSADYSPIWDVSPVAWTPAAVRSGARRRITSSSQVAALARRGLIVSAGTGPRNASLGGIRALGAVSNCTTVAVLR